MSFFTKLFFFALFTSSFILVGCQGTETVNTDKQPAKDLPKEMSAFSQGESGQELSTLAYTQNPVSAHTTSDKTKNHDLTIGEEIRAGNISIQFERIDELSVNQFSPNKDKFLNITLKLTNHGEELTELSLLNHFSLIAGKERQDLALIDTQNPLTIEIPAGKTVTGQLTYDSVLSESYSFIYEDLSIGEKVQWQFSYEDVQSLD